MSTSGTIMVIELAIIGVADIFVAVNSYKSWGNRHYPSVPKKKKAC